jgi:hypothetical protein
MTRFVPFLRQLCVSEILMSLANSASEIPDAGYERGLSPRAVRMIAIGGAIGTGLFYGAGGAIEKAGPALILGYLAAGFAIFIIMRALGELLVYRPVSGSISEYAEEFLGRFAGFANGWTYWAVWITTCMAEITVAGKYVKFWWPAIPEWVTAPHRSSCPTIPMCHACRHMSWSSTAPCSSATQVPPPVRSSPPRAPVTGPKSAPPQQNSSLAGACGSANGSPPIGREPSGNITAPEWGFPRGHSNRRSVTPATRLGSPVPGCGRLSAPR